MQQRLQPLSRLGLLDDADLAAEIESEASELEATLDALELRSMLRGADDQRNAIVTIHAGAGGTESQDWAEMLMRMYSRWAELEEIASS